MTQQAMQLGRVLNERYRIEAVLGRGAVGAVYCAMDLRTGRLCAIKILHTAVDENSDAHARFVNEGQIVAQLFHPNIVEMQEFGSDEDGTPFLVMEMLHGPTLLDLIRGGGRLPLSRVIHIARQVGSALHAAHSVGIVHRDIKPQNIVLHRDSSESGRGGGKETVKVVDFGLSRMLSARGQQTAPGIIVGTIEYMSPEATSGRREDVDARTDQWALAVVVYRLLSGTLPYQDRDPVRLLLKIRSGRHVPLSQHVPVLPPFVSAAVERALAKDKQQRFDSVQDFVRALQGLPLRLVAASGGEAAVSAAHRPPVPQAVVVEISSGYAEYSTTSQSGPLRPDRRGETLSAPGLASSSARRLAPVAAAESAAQQALSAARAATPATAGSLGGPLLVGLLPAPLWLTLLGLLLVAMTLFAMVLAGTRSHLGALSQRPQTAAESPTRYLPLLLGSR